MGEQQSTASRTTPERPTATGVVPSKLEVAMDHVRKMLEQSTETAAVEPNIAFNFAKDLHPGDSGAYLSRNLPLTFGNMITESRNRDSYQIIVERQKAEELMWFVIRSGLIG